MRIGIDFGGTNIAAGLVDGVKLIDSASVKTAVPRPLEAMLDDMAALSRLLQERNGVAAESVGVGVPCTADLDNGHIEDADWFQVADADFVTPLQRRVGLPVYFGNDANAAAWGEFLAGGYDVDSLVFVTLGTGIGGGVILNRRLWTGFNHAAGEFGHITLKSDGEPCFCGRRGCFERYASATALIESAKKSAEKSDFLRECEKIEAKTVFDGAKAGDAVCEALLDKYTSWLSEGLADIINIFQPQVLCIGGGVSHAGDALLSPVRIKTAARVYSRHAARNTRIELARLGNDAGIIGAALLAENI